MGTKLAKVTALFLGVALVAGAAEKSLEQLKTEYQNNKTAENAVEVLKKQRREGNFSDAVSFGKTAYNTTESVDVALHVGWSHMGLDQYGKSVEFAQSAYNATPHWKLAHIALDGLNKSGQYQKAVDFGKTAYSNTPNQHLKRLITKALKNIDTQRAIEYGKQAYTEYGSARIGNIVVNLLEKSSAEDAVRYAASAYKQNPDYTLADKAFQIMENNSLPDSVVEVVAMTIANNWPVKGVNREQTERFAEFLDGQSSAIEQQVAETATGRHIRALLRSNLNAQKFREALNVYSPLRQGCNDSFRVNQIDRMLDEVPLAGSFADWEPLIRELKYRKSRLSQ